MAVRNVLVGYHAKLAKVNLCCRLAIQTRAPGAYFFTGSFLELQNSWETKHKFMSPELTM